MAFGVEIMEGNPPPYTAEASAQTPMTSRQSVNKEGIVFVEAVIRRNSFPYIDVTAHLYSVGGCIYHAHEPHRDIGTTRDNNVQLVGIKKDLGYKALVERLTSARCHRRELDLFPTGWTKRMVEVSGVQVIWEGLHLDVEMFGTWMTGSDETTRIVLEKMEQRGWKDLIVIHFKVVER